MAETERTCIECKWPRNGLIHKDLLHGDCTNPDSPRFHRFPTFGGSITEITPACEKFEAKEPEP